MNEQNNQELHSVQSELQLSISVSAANYLAETGRWTKFLSIVGFILTGIVVLAGIFAGTMMSIFTQGQMGDMPAGFNIIFGGVYVLMGLLYFFPAYYLLKFSQKLKEALSMRDNGALNTAFENQKSFFKFWGILMIIFLVLYGLMGIVAIGASFLV